MDIYKFRQCKSCRMVFFLCFAEAFLLFLPGLLLQSLGSDYHHPLRRAILRDFLIQHICFWNPCLSANASNPFTIPWMLSSSAILYPEICPPFIIRSVSYILGYCLLNNGSMTVFSGSSINTMICGDSNGASFLISILGGNLSKIVPSVALINVCDPTL